MTFSKTKNYGDRDQWFPGVRRQGECNCSTRLFSEGVEMVLYSDYAGGYTNLHRLKFVELYTKKV